MDQKTVELYPVVGMQVKIATDQKVVILHLPYIKGFGTAAQQELQDRAYCLLPEQAVLLRDALNEVIDQIRSSSGDSEFSDLPPRVN